MRRTPYEVSFLAHLSPTTNFGLVVSFYGLCGTPAYLWGNRCNYGNWLAALDAGVLRPG